MRRKISVIGAHGLGLAVAQRIANRDLADLVVVDHDGDLAAAVATDLSAALALEGSEAEAIGRSSYDDVAGSKLVVLCGGDVAEASKEVADRAPDAVILIAAPPVAHGVFEALHASAFPRRRVIGVAGLPQAARLRCSVATATGVSPRDVTALVLGGADDEGEVVPVRQSVAVAGVPAATMLGDERFTELLERSDGRAPAGVLSRSAAATAMVEAMVRDQPRVLTGAAQCSGEYGIDGAVAGVPCRLGKRGLEEIVEIPLPPDELDRLRASAVSPPQAARR